VRKISDTVSSAIIVRENATGQDTASDPIAARKERAYRYAWNRFPQFRHVAQSPDTFCFSSQFGQVVHDEPP